jgi:putative tryptophan/tyrosine transport system substrate-binding protein
MPVGRTNRRAFIAALGSAAVWPPVARAQQGERIRRLAMVTGIMDEAGTRARYTAFFTELARLGRMVGRNLRIEYRWGEGGASNMRKNAAELTALAPDVIVATGGATLEFLLETTRSVPIVFTLVPDPVGSGYVDSLSRPGGNATGFAQFEYGVTGKWLELLKEIVPSVKRTVIFWDPKLPAGIGQFAIIQSVAPSLGIDVIPIKPSDPSQIERAITSFATAGSGGLIVTSYPQTIVQRELIASMAARHELPAVYSTKDFVASGGLLFYAADILYELVINLKVARVLGLDLPQSVIARADEVIE